MKKLSILYLLFLSGPLWGQPLDLSPASATQTITVKEPTLDLKSVMWVFKKDYAGEVTPDIVGGDCVTIFNVKSGSQFPAFHQGDSLPTMLTTPDSKSEVLAVFGVKSGTVTIVLWGTSEKGKPIKLGSSTITVGDGKVVPPQPDPKPNPDPTPSPTSKNLYWVILRDPMAVSPAQANLIGDTKFWDAFKASGDEWDSFSNVTAVDGVETTQSRNGYLKQVSDLPLPALLVMDKDTGKVIDKFSLTDKDGKTVMRDDLKSKRKGWVK